MRYLRLYKSFIRQSVMSSMMYKSDFIVWSFVSIGWFVFNIIFYNLLYANVGNIHGWDITDMLIFQGIYFILEFFLWGMMWQNMNSLPGKINTGALDMELVKPVSPRFLLAFRVFRWNNFNSFLLGVGTIIYAYTTSGRYASISQVLLSAVALISSCVLIYAIWLTTMCAAFFVGRLNNLQHLFPGIRQFWKVPQPFYAGVIKTFLTYVFPITLISTVPAEYLRGNNPYMLTGVLMFAAFISLKINKVVFNYSIKKYSGASA